MTVPGPCVVCGLRNYELSVGGADICPSCDCGSYGPAVVKRQRARITSLESSLAEARKGARTVRNAFLDLIAESKIDEIVDGDEVNGRSVTYLSYKMDVDGQTMHAMAEAIGVKPRLAESPLEALSRAIDEDATTPQETAEKEGGSASVSLNKLESWARQRLLARDGGSDGEA